MYSYLFFGFYNFFKSIHRKDSIDFHGFYSILNISVFTTIYLDILFRFMKRIFNFEYHKICLFIIFTTLFVIQVVLIYKFSYMEKILKKFIKDTKQKKLISYILTILFILGSILLVILYTNL